MTGTDIQRDPWSIFFLIKNRLETLTTEYKTLLDIADDSRTPEDLTKAVKDLCNKSGEIMGMLDESNGSIHHYSELIDLYAESFVKKEEARKAEIAKTIKAADITEYKKLAGLEPLKEEDLKKVREPIIWEEDSQGMLRRKSAYQ